MLGLIRNITVQLCAGHTYTDAQYFRQKLLMLIPHFTVRVRVGVRVVYICRQTQPKAKHNSQQHMYGNCSDMLACEFQL